MVAILEAGTGISLETCGGAVIAAISNIGPGFGAVGPTENFGHFREATQVFLAWLMILGRLELFALLVLVFPERVAAVLRSPASGKQADAGQIAVVAAPPRGTTRPW